MSTTLLYKSLGQSYALNCGVSTRGPVTIVEQATAMALLNSGVTAALVTFTQFNYTGPPPAVGAPRDGTPSGAQIVSVMLPGNMNLPIYAAVPAGGCNMYGVSVSSGISVVYATPLEIQS